MTIRLRALAPDDADRVLAWRNAPSVAAYMYTDRAITAEEHALWIAAALSASDRFTWIIEAEGAPVGLATLRRLSDDQRYDWAFYLADETLRGRGAGASVEFIVLEFAFCRLGARKLWCEVLGDNEAVWRLHEGFGFVREALLRAHVVKDGAPRDVVGLGLLYEEWMASRAGFETRLRTGGRLGSPLA